MARTPDQIFADKIAFILKSEKDLDEAVVSHQKLFLELILAEYIPLFEVVDGFVADSAANSALLQSVDRLFDKVQKALNKDVLAPFVVNLIASSELSAEYYKGLGFSKTVVAGILKSKVALADRLGVTPTGRLRKSGYLYRLGRTAQVRDSLFNYVLSNLTGDVSFTDFQLGFRNLVVGNRRTKGLATKGALQKYFDQFAYDTFSQEDAITNRQFAKSLQLEHFMYEGSLIDTSRKFCIKRAGKAFKVSETRTWKNDPDLIDKKTKSQYRPLIDRGRYRCRHFIKYITKELYEALTGKKG